MNYRAGYGEKSICIVFILDQSDVTTILVV